MMLKQTVAVVSLLVSGLGMAAETVVVEGDTATHILNLDINGTLYDVAFEYETFESLNVGDNFPFIGDVPGTGDEAGAQAVAEAIVVALNNAGAIEAGSSETRAIEAFAVPP